MSRTGVTPADTWYLPALISVLAPLARASALNFHSDTSTPASVIWRVAPRSVLPGRIEKSTDGAARSTGDRANQSSQPQNPSAEAAASRINNFSRNSIGSGWDRRIGSLD